MSERRACHCADVTRSRVLRQAAAQAGRGLPSVERGMPLPAGTGLSRRSFLLRSAGLAVSVYGASLLAPRFLEEGVARAAADPAGPVLVSVFLDGGADSLSLLFPDGDSDYRRLRPTLALAAGSGRLGDRAVDEAARGAAALRGLHQPGALPGRQRRRVPEAPSGLRDRAGARNVRPHANQPGPLDSGLRLTAATLLAFQRDLEARGRAGCSSTSGRSSAGARARERLRRDRPRRRGRRLPDRLARARANDRRLPRPHERPR